MTQPHPHPHPLGRRGFLTSAAATGTAAAAALGAGSAAADGPGDGTDGRAGGGSRSLLNRADKAFLQHGLIHAVWVRGGSEDGWIPDQKLWKDSGFTTPHFYGEDIAESAKGVLEYSEEVMRGAHKKTWALARAPFPKALTEAELPDPGAEWMTEAMAAHTDTLFSVCFGDEEARSDELVEYFTNAFAAMHRDHPEVLVHNNQALSQYPGNELADFVRTAKPDLVTWDWYGWQQEPVWPGGSPRSMYAQLGRYRAAALAGTDGSGEDPIAFGQYTIGFRLQPAWDTEEDRYKRRVYVSESQQNLWPYVTWAAGGKWLSLFRWELAEDYAPWETDGLFLTDADETPLPAYERYQRINADMAAFSPYLTRLRSATFARVPGRDEAGEPIPSPTAAIPDLTAQTDPGSGVLGVSVQNLGTAHGGNPGDVLVGTFRPIPGLSARENAGVLADRADTPAFMLVNGLTDYNSDNTDPFGTEGSGERTRQALTVSVAVPEGKELVRVGADRPRPQRVPLEEGADGAQFTVELDGGAGALYLWA